MYYLSSTVTVLLIAAVAFLTGCDDGITQPEEPVVSEMSMLNQGNENVNNMNNENGEPVGYCPPEFTLAEISDIPTDPQRKDEDLDDLDRNDDGYLCWKSRPAGVKFGGTVVVIDNNLPHPPEDRKRLGPKPRR